MSVWYRGSIIPGNVPATWCTRTCTCTRRCTVAGGLTVEECARVCVYIHICVCTCTHTCVYMEEKCRNVPLRRQTSAWRELKQSVRGWLHRFSTLPRSNPPLHSFCPAPLFIVSVHAVFALLLHHPLHPLRYRLARVTSLDRSKVDWRRDATSY